MRQECGCINRHNTTELRPDLQVIFNRRINCGPDLGSHARNGLNRVNRLSSSSPSAGGFLGESSSWEEDGVGPRPGTMVNNTRKGD
eukprot:scaffold112699_cov61-Attheya_sp.AAC.1